MRAIERLHVDNELGNMVERILYHDHLIWSGDPRAEAYWRFVEHSYAEQGYDQAEFYELLCAGAEVVDTMNRDLGRL